MADIKTTCLALLKANHNIILSGAPGTGKTYMAKQIADKLTGGDKSRIGFVQFHPSYDYTDFVEGLRPTPPSGSTIGFERKDGIFKEFCEKALEALKEYNKSLTTIGALSSTSTSMAVTSPITAGSTLAAKIKVIYKKIVDDINAGKKHTIKTVNGKVKELFVNGNDNLYVKNGTDVVLTLDMLLRISEHLRTKQEIVEATDFRGITKIKNWDTDLRAIMIYIYSIIESEVSDTDDVSSEISTTELENPNIERNSPIEIAPSMEYPYFVFIIDEINRGEISKVFGELFFSIDPGYRGENGAVRTQYANMVSSPNAFDKVLETKDYGHFFVPENVYIIGTMNDIDRSVDSMDFAMRRRFLIKDIKAEDTQKDMLTDDAIIAKMNALNAVIEGESWEKIKAKLGTSYSLGASYFQKYYKYNDFKLLWEYHLEGILREYLRGTQNPERDLKILKKVYEEA